MLWKPATPVYPKLIKEVPEGLTKEEAYEMRRKGHDLPPICKLGIKLLINFILIDDCSDVFEVWMAFVFGLYLQVSYF